MDTLIPADDPKDTPRIKYYNRDKILELLQKANDVDNFVYA